MRLPLALGHLRAGPFASPHDSERNGELGIVGAIRATNSCDATIARACSRDTALDVPSDESAQREGRSRQRLSLLAPETAGLTRGLDGGLLDVEWDMGDGPSSHARLPAHRS